MAAHGRRVPAFLFVPVDPNIGRRVDRYFILRLLLGRGGMGAGYLAEHEARAHIKGAIQLMLAELTPRHPVGILRYRTETEAVSSLRYDSTVRLENSGVLDNGNPCASLLWPRTQVARFVPFARTKKGGVHGWRSRNNA